MPPSCVGLHDIDFYFITMNSIPFKLPDVGLYEVGGYIYFEEDFLVFDVEKSLFGEFEADEQTIKVEPSAIEEIELKQGIFKDKLCIRPKKHDLLKAMPGSFKEELKLSLSRKQRDKVHQLVEEFNRRTL